MASGGRLEPRFFTLQGQSSHFAHFSPAISPHIGWEPRGPPPTTQACRSIPFTCITALVTSINGVDKANLWMDVFTYPRTRVYGAT
jgi:hypothetical protein